MRKITVLLLSVLLVCVSGCADNSSNGTSANGEKMIKVGLVQFAEHPALDEATEGFEAALKDAGYIEGENIKFDYQNAQSDPSNCITIADKFINDRVDLIFANATPAAQAVVGKTIDIPVVITSVTDPATSGLVDSNESTGNNVTGTSDLTPIASQIDLLTKLLPEAKVVGLMYNGSEDNSIFQAEIAKREMEAKGLKVQEATVSDSNAIQSVTESLIGKVDAIYVPTDNLLADGMATVTMITNENKIPTIVAEEGLCLNGGLATIGLSYYNLGYKTGEMAVKILQGVNPADLPIEYLPVEECTLTINKSTADELGITIPQELLDEATIVE